MAAVVPDKKFIKAFTSGDALDAMLCRGWIDGLSKGFDDKPRKPPAR